MYVTREKNTLKITKPYIIPLLHYYNNSHLSFLSSVHLSFLWKQEIILPYHMQHSSRFLSMTKVTNLVDKGKAMDVIYLNFNKVFTAIFHEIFISNIRECRLNLTSIMWVYNWLDNHAQKAVIYSSMPKLEEVRPHGSCTV